MFGWPFGVYFLFSFFWFVSSQSTLFVSHIDWDSSGQQRVAIGVAFKTLSAKSRFREWKNIIIIDRILLAFFSLLQLCKFRCIVKSVYSLFRKSKTQMSMFFLFVQMRVELNLLLCCILSYFSFLSKLGKIKLSSVIRKYIHIHCKLPLTLWLNILLMIVLWANDSSNQCQQNKQLNIMRKI